MKRLLGLMVALAWAGAGATEPLPLVDLSAETNRQVVIAQGTEKVYQGHPTTLLAEDGRTMFCVWTIGHGGKCGPMAKSTDGGRTWTRIDDQLPSEFHSHLNCPTFQKVPRPGGGVNYCAFSANGQPGTGGGLGILMSADEGKTWKVMPPATHLSAGMPPTGFMPLKDGSSALFGQVRKPGVTAGDAPTSDQAVWMSVTRDGGKTWSPSRIIATAEKKNLCEPFAVRSPDGKEIAVLMRENRHDARSMMTFSSDEGKTWSTPVDTCWGLTGDRHEGLVLPDGRLIVAFRDRALKSPTYGQYVAWVGTWHDLRTGAPGQYRIHLVRSYAGTKHGGFVGDTGYSGVERLPDGTIVCTTYCKINPDRRLQSVVSTRFRIEETDAAECPVNPNVRGHENIEWSISYAFHLTDANNEIVKRLNAVAQTVISEFGGVGTNDLYGAMDGLDATHRSAAYWRDDYHFTPTAIDLQAERVAAACLGGKKL